MIQNGCFTYQEYRKSYHRMECGCVHVHVHVASCMVT